MATNLRLRPDAEAALRERARQTGRSQQEIIREAIDCYLDLGEWDRKPSEAHVLLGDRQVSPPRSSFRELPTDDLVRVPKGTSSLGLLDRDERL